MDINDIRTLITTLSFLVFVGIVYWAWSGRQRTRFDEAEKLPFADEDLPGTANVTSTGETLGARS